jgi:hypothetical protein
VARNRDWDVVICRRPERAPEPSGRPEDVTWKELFFIAPLPSSWLVHRRCFDAAGLFDEDLKTAEDRDMILRLAEKCQVGAVYGQYVRHREHGKNLSSQPKQVLNDFQKVIEKAFSREANTPLWFRQRGRSYTHMIAAMDYGLEEKNALAIKHDLISLARWPLPLGERYVRPFQRIRHLVCRFKCAFHRNES